MTISRLIQLSVVREHLDVVLPDYERTLGNPIRVPSRQSTKPQLIWAAFDYALRFELSSRFPRVRDSLWIAERAARELEREVVRDRAALRRAGLASQRDIFTRIAERVAAKAANRVARARAFVADSTNTRTPTRRWRRRAAEHALNMARLDPFHRSGYFGSGLIESNSEDARTDVVELLEAVPAALLVRPKRALLNPRFGAYSRRVGGADADLIVDGRLIELKAAANDCVERTHVRQLVAYLVLAERLRRDGARRFPKLDALEIYFARHGVIWTIPTRPIVEHPEFERAGDVLLKIADELRVEASA